MVVFLSLVLSHADGYSRSRWSHTQPEINLTHVFMGEINRKGKPVGYHSRPGGKDPDNARVVKILARSNCHGVYTARVALFDSAAGAWKEKFSSFFPDNLAKKEVVEAILHAWKNKEKGRQRPWQGPSGLGFTIQGYLNKRGNITTAFPLYRKESPGQCTP